MKPAGQMTLTLTSELEQFVREQVKRGAFASSSEYIRDLVRERYVREREREARLKALDEALARGLADADVQVGPAQADHAAQHRGRIVDSLHLLAGGIVGENRAAGRPQRRRQHVGNGDDSGVELVTRLRLERDARPGNRMRTGHWLSCDLWLSR